MARSSLLLLAILVPAALSGCLHDDNAWALSATGLDVLRERGLAGDLVKVAILDTGVDLSAPSLRHLADGDLLNGEMVGYEDFVGDDGGPHDADGHGTFVAGVLAGDAQGPFGSLRPSASVRGAAPHVHLLVGRVCQGDVCSLWALAQGLAWAIEQGADVVSLSLGVDPRELRHDESVAMVLRANLDKAEAKGILVVAAAGNGGALRFPASEPSVLAVGAAGPDLLPVRLPSGGPIDLLAPGRGIVGPDRGHGLVQMDGSSAAVPFVAAAAALALGNTSEPPGRLRLQELRQSLAGLPTPSGGVPALLRADLAVERYASLCCDPKS